MTIAGRRLSQAHRWVISRARLTVLFDGDCPLCVAAIDRWVRRLDWLGLLHLQSFRDDSAVLPSGVRYVDLERRMHTVSERGRVVAGFHAVTAIAARLPATWLLVPFLMALKAGRVGDRLYQWVADRRALRCTSTCARMDPKAGAENADLLPIDLKPKQGA
jgi:predicted DCC family thiol-disulfide oxidoreductase YuxK